MSNSIRRPAGSPQLVARVTEAEYVKAKELAAADGISLAERIRRRSLSSDNAIPEAMVDARSVYACAYCPAEFATEFDAEAHIDNTHPKESQ